MASEYGLFSGRLAGQDFIQVFQSWQSYPDNILAHTTETLALAEQFQRHFNQTKAKVLLVVNQHGRFRVSRLRALRKKIKVVFHDCGIDDHITFVPTPALETSTHTRLNIEDSIQVDSSWIAAHKVEDLHEIFGLNVLPWRQADDGDGFRQDPVCRFIFINTVDPVNRTRLAITEEMLLKILTYHQVGPAFLNYISHSGLDSLTGHSDLYLGGFRHLKSFSNSSDPRLDVKMLGRSGFHYQLAFDFKSVFASSAGTLASDGIFVLDSGDGLTEIVEAKHSNLTEWQLDTTAIHHHFDIVYGKSLWVIARAPQEKATWTDISGMEKKPFPISITSNSAVEERFNANLTVLPWLGEGSLSEFGFYINEIDVNLQILTSQAYTGDTKEESVESILLRTRILNQHIESLDRCAAALESNHRVFSAILDFYCKQLFKDKKLQALKLPWLQGEGRAKVDEGIIEFEAKMGYICSIITDMLQRTATLKQMGTRRDNMLQQLLQNRNDATMRQLAHVTKKDSTTIIVFSTITLILLPMSVVSTVLSAGIVKFEEGSSYAGTWSVPATVWWAVATVLITTVVGVGAKFWREREIHPGMNQHRRAAAAPAAQISFGRPPSMALIYLLRLWYNTKMLLDTCR
ncbi:hypothetical protein B0T24DRAFT_670308 [Lasiosphaeria ovina]|uniref:CorA-like transporter domain-containing protein n=1 Tax=Lasiosphaeria ovina TaxID=92902 RepID=A0AAE0JXN3_9PEZI|nr:hypothetical protein B0T24DRAFT_670308 [Lasiosphaeria ovina]